MGTVSDILCQKRVGPLVTSTADENVLEATQRMNEYSIGALLVMDDDRMVGIFTERDVLRRVVAEERIPSTVMVGDVMTTQVVCCAPETTIDDAQNMMRQYRVRHIPVIDHGGDVQGILSIGDVNAYHASNQEVAIHYMQEYVLGRVS